MADDVAAVVVTYDALPWIEQCLDSLRGVETVVVDNGSRDGTVAFVRERYPDARVVEAENRGLGAGWNIGLRETVEHLRAAPERRRLARATARSSGSSRSPARGRARRWSARAS